MKFTHLAHALALLLAPTVGLGHARPQAELELLGVLPGTLYSVASVISGDGKVIYGTSFLSGSVRGFRWTASGGMQELAHQGQPLLALDSNFDGSVFVGGLPTTHTPYRATAGGAVLDLGLLSTWVAATARAVSADGSVVVGEAELQPAPWFTTRASRWTAATGPVELPVPSGGALLMGADYVSADGTVIVGRVDTGVRLRAFVWRATTGTQLLPTLPSADLPSQVTGLSADGRYAIGHVAGSVQGVPDRAVRWDLTTGTLSFVFGPGETNRRLDGINRDGSVLAGTVDQRGFGLSAQSGEVVLANTGTLTSSASAINDDGTVIVGSNRMQGAASSIAFRYEFPGLGTPYCAGVPNSTGAAAATLATGSSDASENRVTLFAQGLPNQSFGYFLTSANQGASANPGGSQGTFCLQGSIGRFVGPGQIQSSGNTGRFELTLDLTQHPTPAGFVSVQSGQTWNFTAWYRDSVAGSPTSNFSGGLEVRFR